MPTKPKTKMRNVSTTSQEKYQTEDGNVTVTNLKRGLWQVFPRGHAPFTVGSKREAFDQAAGISSRHWGMPKEQAFPRRPGQHATKKSGETYTVHGHFRRRDGRQEAFWTRTGLSKSQAQKLAREQRAESGGVAEIVREEGPAYGRRAHAAKKSSAQLDREIAESLAGRREFNSDNPFDVEIGDAVQLRWEPQTSGVVRRSLPSKAEGRHWVEVATSRGPREVPIDALRPVRPEHEARVRAAVERK